MSVKPTLTVADLDLMPDDGNRYELVEGEVLVSRAPSLVHQRIAGNVFTGLRIYLSRNPIGEVLATPGVMFNEFNGVIPDLVFISYERRDEIAAGERITGAPDLVVEILSPGAENARRDRVLKRQIYGKFGVMEYWLVDGENRSVEIYRNIGGALEPAATLQAQDNLNSPLLPGFECCPF